MLLVSVDKYPSKKVLVSVDKYPSKKVIVSSGLSACMSQQKMN